MKLSREIPTLALALAVPLAFGACANRNEETPATEETPPPAATPAPETPAPGATPAVVQFGALNDSGVTGDVQIQPEGDQVTLTVHLMGVEANSTHDGMIHTGTCDSPGPVETPLDPITADATGAAEATLTVAVAPATVMDGNHIIVYHEASGDPGQPISCAAVPQQSGMGM